MFGEAEILGEELVQDIDPNLYVKRAEEALKNGKYSDAINEIDKAIEYAENKFDYIYQKVQILFSIGKYSNCYNLIMKEVYPKFESLSKEHKEEVYVYIAKCFKKCNMNPENFEFIILAPNGEGMYKSIQDAINSTNKRIYLTNGIYNENFLINKNITLDSNYATIKLNNTDGLIIEAYSANINNITFENISNNENSNTVTVTKGNIKFYNCTFINNKYNGIKVLGNSIIEINFSCIKSSLTALLISGMSKAVINSSKFDSSVGKNCVFNYSYLEAFNSEFSSNKNKESSCINLYSNSTSKIDKCTIFNSDYGILNSKNADCIITNSKIYNTNYGICSLGNIKINDSIIRNNDRGINILNGIANINNTNSYSNLHEGILVDGISNVNIKDCTFNGNETGGFFKDGKIKIINSNFYGNKLCGVYNESKCTNMVSSKSYDNGSSGVISKEKGFISLLSCKIYCNKAPNISATTKGTVNANNCSISSSSESGVYSYDGGFCNLTNCSIFKNAGNGVCFDNGGTVKETECNIYDNDSIIGALSGIRRFFRGV